MYQHDDTKYRDDSNDDAANGNAAEDGHDSTDPMDIEVVFPVVPAAAIASPRVQPDILQAAGGVYTLQLQFGPLLLFFCRITLSPSSLSPSSSSSSPSSSSSSSSSSVCPPHAVLVPDHLCRGRGVNHTCKPGLGEGRMNNFTS